MADLPTLLDANACAVLAIVFVALGFIILFIAVLDLLQRLGGRDE